MRNKLILSLVFIISLFISCGENSKKKETDKNHQHTDSEKVGEHQVKQEHKQKPKAVLSLNDGSHWNANVETTAGIKNMIALMDSFTEKEDVKSYNKLKGSLEKEFMSILTNCSMEGEPHNQLHTYLVPMKDAFKGLYSDDLAVCKESFENLNKRLGEYKTYFK